MKNLLKREYYTLEETAQKLKLATQDLICLARNKKLEICVHCSHLNPEHLDPEKKSISHIFPNSDFFNKRFEFTDASFLQVGYDEIKRVIISSSKNESIWLLKSDNSSYWDIWNKDDFNFFLVIPDSELLKVEKNQREISLHTAAFPGYAEYTVEDVNNNSLYKGALPAICFSGGVTVSIKDNLYVMAEEIERLKNLYQKESENQIEVLPIQINDDKEETRRPLSIPQQRQKKLLERIELAADRFGFDIKTIPYKRGAHKSIKSIIKEETLKDRTITKKNFENDWDELLKETIKTVEVDYDPLKEWGIKNWDDITQPFSSPDSSN